jgi:hypothetical protein
MNQAVVIGMLASVSFAFIDALNFLIIETPLDNLWKKLNVLNASTIPIVNGGISAAISIFFALYIEQYLERHYTLFKHPLIDAAGIIVGTIAVLLLYKLYLWFVSNEAKAKPLVMAIYTKIKNIL